MTWCGWCTCLSRCSFCTGGCAQISGSAPSLCLQYRFLQVLQHNTAGKILDYSHVEVVHGNNSSLLVSHHSLNRLSDISTNLRIKLPKILTPRPQYWDRQQMLSGRVWKSSTEFLHPVLGETAKTSKKRNLHAGIGWVCEGVPCPMAQHR